MTTDALFCANHPNVATSLRCNRCEKPICAKCAKRTPTGYRCPECLRELGKVHITAEWSDYLIGFVVALILSFIASSILNNIGWFTIFLSPLAGGFIGELAHRAVRRRRAPNLFKLIAAGVALGGLWPVAVGLFILLFGGFEGLWFILWPLVYVLLATGSAYARLTGIQLSR